MDSIADVDRRHRFAIWIREHRASLAIVVVAALAVGVGWWYRVLDGSVGVYTVMRGDLVQSVVASGQVITPQRASIAAEITGRVVRVPVAEGERVRRAQVLVELDQSDELAALAQANAALSQTEARLRQMATSTLPMAEQALRQATANLTQAERAYQRTSDLVASHFVSRAQLDDAQRNLDVAQSQVRAAELQVANARPGGSDFAVADMTRREAEAAIIVNRAKLAATVIRAPADGVLIARSVEPGDVAQPGKELMLLAPAGETQIVVNIDERNLGKLAIGQKAFASTDAFPGEVFAAELFYLNPGVDAVRGTVQAKLRVPNPPAYVRQDMSVSVDIEVGRQNDVLWVPMEAVHEAGTPHPWVLTVRGGRTTKQPVKLGMRGDAAVEILSGLATGEAVVPATNLVVTAGQRVRTIALAKDAAR